MKKNREQLVEENRWVVNDVINKYTHLMQRDELESAGLHGLIEGIDRYKEGKGAKVSTYVRHWVRAKVLAAVYENRTVHIPWNKINKHVCLMYKKYNLGEEKNIVGIDVPWHEPVNSDLVVNMNDYKLLSIREFVDPILE